LDKHVEAAPLLKGEIMRKKRYWILALVAATFIIAMWPAVYAGREAEPLDGPAAVPDSRGSLVETATRPRTALTWRDTLVGLQGVHVLVEDLRPEVEKHGLTEQALKTDTELRLRQYGVKVLEAHEFSERMSVLYQEGFRRVDAATLYISIGLMTDEELGLAAVNANIKLSQPVILPRGTKMLLCNATTWERGRVLLYRSERLNEVRGQLKDLVDQFINDYLAANPGQQPAKEKEK